jgi:hypothetical protein
MTSAFAENHQTLDDAALMPRHAKLGEEVFVPVRPSSSTGDAIREAGFTVLHVFEKLGGTDTSGITRSSG